MTQLHRVAEGPIQADLNKRLGYTLLFSCSVPERDKGKILERVREFYGQGNLLQDGMFVVIGNEDTGHGPERHYRLIENLCDDDEGVVFGHGETCFIVKPEFYNGEELPLLLLMGLGAGLLGMGALVWWLITQ